MKMTQQKITQTTDAVKWAVNGDDAEAAAETRKRARQCGPDCVALLHHVVITDNFASTTQPCARGEYVVGSGRVPFI